MNYIKRLQKEKKTAEIKVEELEKGLNQIRRYLALPKFNGNVMVNKQDILNRIQDTFDNVDEVVVELSNEKL